MSTSLSLLTEIIPAFQLKGGLYPFTALQLLSSDLAYLDEQLRHKLQQAPQFFKNAPIVLDIHKLSEPEQAIDFEQLLSLLRVRQLVVVGVRGGSPAQQQLARRQGLAILQNPSRSILSDSSKLPVSTAEVEGPVIDQEIIVSAGKLITEPVRSGQQIYARGGDLVIFAPVSQGSEILADGHIHVYGPLRGRALAGVMGNTQARIFCHSLEAELVSIAGQYKLSEDIETQAWKIPATISLVAERLQIQPL